MTEITKSPKFFSSQDCVFLPYPATRSGRMHQNKHQDP